MCRSVLGNIAPGSCRSAPALDNGPATSVGMSETVKCCGPSKKVDYMISYDYMIILYAI